MHAYWVIATDASSLAMGAVVTTIDHRYYKKSAQTQIFEDHAWLVKTSHTHIHVSELQAVIQGISVFQKYSRAQDQVTILVDNESARLWLENFLNDNNIQPTGIHQVLIVRRLEILRVLLSPYQVIIERVNTTDNPADALTRVPVSWQIPKVSGKQVSMTEEEMNHAFLEMDPGYSWLFYAATSGRSNGSLETASFTFDKE